jgi:tRNA A-37 threonylcarbamoyl transferase component Bud32
MDCPSPAELTDFLAGKLPRTRTAWVADHVRGCSRCEASLAALDQAPDPLLATLASTVAQGRASDTVPMHLIELARAARTGVATPDKIGRFESLEAIGSGSYGTVFKARDSQLNRSVAIKILRAGRLGGQEELDRFLREARSFAQLKHPGIVTLYEIGQDGGQYYLVEEFVPGSNLAARMTDAALGFRESAELLARVCDALQAAHQQGVIHRDIKPANILLDGEGRPHLTDFGLAKVEGDEKPMTHSGDILGTPAYMSPEQAGGQALHVDARSDVYSLGVVLYELLTRERPFQGNRRMLILQVLEDEPRAPRQLNEKIPRDLETICLKAMAKIPGRRYGSAAELAEDLRRFLAGEPIKARPQSGVERLMSWTRRRPAAAALIAVSFTALALLATLSSAAYVRIAAEQRQTKQALVQNARLTLEALKEFNEYYTTEVVGRLTDRSIQVTHDYAGKKNAIPLPATMSVELADRISHKNPSLKIRLYSDLPFPWRLESGGPKDQFERDALRELRSKPGQPYYVEDGRSLRYATSSRMEKRCVDCHNAMKESPKRDWKEGDVVGVYEVSLPVDR